MSDAKSDETPEKAESPRDWYTVEEAAEYLEVSRPTIFRWMKQGKLSYYKVGGSTRFTRESLDALIEKVTGEKEAQAAAGRCTSCGHSTLISGHVQTTGRLYFKPEKTKFWTFQQSMVPIKALVCPACGNIQLAADTEKLESLIPESDRETDER
jgi:excisionase family DNA binding protein